jgi:methyl-accepting chemotaxis protein
MLAAATECRNAIAFITEKARGINTRAKQMPQDTVKSANQWEVFITAIGFGLSIVLGVVFSGIVSRPIRHLADRANRISEGDLRVEVSDRKSRDELGMLTRSFRIMLAKLREQTRKTLDSVNVLNGASSELSSTISQLVVNSGTFADSVSEITATVEQVKQSAGVASEKAKNVAEISHEAVRVSAAGKQATDETVSRMTLIKKQMGAVGKTVVKLSEQSNAIEDIIGTVQDLSDQSNLLAVNASVEAARAGDHGKGFSVVAHEIKSLADQSKEATQQIRHILQEVRKWVSAVVMATEQGTKAVDAGVEQSVTAGESIDVLADTVSQAAQAASVIQASSAQQLTGVEQVARAMQTIDLALQQHRAGTNQLEELSDHLVQLGQSLLQVVDQYRVS